MESVQYDLRRTESLIREINQITDKMNLNIDKIYNEINKVNLNSMWVCNNSAYVKNSGLSLVNSMEKELLNLKTFIKQIEKNVETYKQIDAEIIKDFE